MSSRRIEVWVCDECDYWRQDKSTGVHQTSNPKDPRGAMVTHPLRKAVFVEAAAVPVEEPEQTP